MPHRDQAETLEATLLRLASPNISPKELLRQTRKLHPKASKKEIIRAAFSSLITAAERDVETSRALQNFALAERAPEID